MEGVAPKALLAPVGLANDPNPLFGAPNAPPVVLVLPNAEGVDEKADPDGAVDPNPVLPKDGVAVVEPNAEGWVDDDDDDANAENPPVAGFKNDDEEFAGADADAPNAEGCVGAPKTEGVEPKAEAWPNAGVVAAPNALGVVVVLPPKDPNAFGFPNAEVPAAPLPNAPAPLPKAEVPAGLGRAPNADGVADVLPKALVDGAGGAFGLAFMAASNASLTLLRTFWNADSALDIKPASYCCCGYMYNKQVHLILKVAHVHIPPLD